MVIPSDCEVCFCDVQGDVMAARVDGIRQEGLKPCRMVPSTRDEVHVQLHDVTGKVQSARAASCRASARAASCRAGTARLKKKNREQKQASLSGEQDSQVRGERRPFLGHRIQLVRGIG